MAGSSSGRILRDVRRIFEVGVVGSMSDAQLLERFVSHKDESAEAAFEELMIRHGPMVVRVCRLALRDTHDAQDAFQAVFLVLANRARVVWRKESVGSWLFGVARRVAARARNRAARRRALDRLTTERTTESYVMPEHEIGCEILHEEVNRLPERLRAPVVLCYFEGLTDAYGRATAGGSPDGTLRGRLAQARRQLRRRLTMRGVVVPAGLMAAGISNQSHAAVHTSLVQSTIRIAAGLTAGETASALARGVLNTMLLSKLGLIAVLVFLGAAAGLSWAAGSNQSEQAAGAKPVAAAATAKVTNDNTKTTSEPAHVRGFVEDQAGRPVAGAVVLVDAFTSRDTRGVTSAGRSFAVPIRHPPYGWAVLVRAPSDHRRGFQRYDFNPTELNVPPRIVLKPSHEVVVRVTDAHQAPIAGASVEAAGDFSVLDDATTGPDGSVKLYVPVDAKVAWVVALKSGTGFDYAEFGVINVHGGIDEAISASELPDAVALTFDGKRTARIKAVDRTGNPLAGVTFYPWTLHMEGRRSYVNVDSQIFNAKTGPDGVVTFDWLPPNDGLMTFWPNAEGFAHRVWS